MTNRIKCIRLYYKLSQEAFAKIFGVDQTAVSNWEKGKNSIDVEIAKAIAEHFAIPMDFIFGVDFEMSVPFESWRSDEQEDFSKAKPEARELLKFKYGKGIFISNSNVYQINHSIIGDGSCNNAASHSEGDIILKNIIDIYKRLGGDLDKKIELYNFAKSLLEDK